MQARTRFFRNLTAGVLALGLAAIIIGDAKASDDMEEISRKPPGGELQTRDGKIYRDVWIDQLDPNGVLFFHRKGAGKVLFADLTPQLQKFFSFDPAAAEAFERGRPEVNVPSSPQPAAAQANASLPPMVLTFRVRTTLPQQQPRYPMSALWAPWGCGTTIAQRYWPRHWGRFHPGHAYAYFGDRQLAERDFLLSTGILPSPVGVHRWRLR